MSFDTFFGASLAVCLATVVVQVVAFYYWHHAGLALATVLPFLVNGSAWTLVRFPKLCEPRTPGCEMAPIAYSYGVVIVAGITVLTLISAIVIAFLGKHRH